jgi:hypothetical protein
MMNEKELKMRGSIRMFIGFFLVYGAVGALDFPENSVLTCLALAVAGLLIGFSGVVAMKGSK